MLVQQVLRQSRATRNKFSCKATLAISVLGFLLVDDQRQDVGVDVTDHVFDELAEDELCVIANHDSKTVDEELAHRGNV